MSSPANVAYFKKLNLLVDVSLLNMNRLQTSLLVLDVCLQHYHFAGMHFYI